MQDWPHQLESLSLILKQIDEGKKRICITCPTGTGKTRIMEMLIRHYLTMDEKVVCYTNRKMLLTQTAKAFGGLDHGIRAANHTDERWKDFQVSSIQTEVSRLKNPEKHRGWTLHNAKLIVIDEAHMNAGPEMRDIICKHIEMGGVVVGFTATPIDLGQVYDVLIVGCTVSEGRRCGALVPAHIYGPDEPDLRRMGIKLKGTDYTEGQAKKALMTATIFGRVYEWYNKLNPQHLPTIGFAPGVPESLYFAQQFSKCGIRSAHIDGSEVWLDGEKRFTSDTAREDIMEAHKDGRIKVIWNRFVMREGIDLKWTRHLILATIFGSLQSYLQSCGRGLRNADGKRICTIQDHGGNWHRFGSPNSDREWFLDYDSNMINALREELLRKAGPGKEPVRCPQCALILAARECSQCGYVSKREVWPRPVVQLDGSLKMIESSMYRKRSIDTRKGAKENWVSMFWGWRKSQKLDKTFRELIAYYQVENSWQYPDPSWPFYPRETLDLFRKIKEVPFDRLNPDPNYRGA